MRCSEELHVMDLDYIHKERIESVSWPAAEVVKNTRPTMISKLMMEASRHSVEAGRAETKAKQKGSEALTRPRGMATLKGMNILLSELFSVWSHKSSASKAVLGVVHRR